MTGNAYLFGNAAVQTVQRFSGLETTFDDATFRYLAATGARPGWACWEVGAGGGSVARWLAGQVAPGGSVLATDVDLGRMPSGPPGLPVLPGLRAERHDVTADPVPVAAYDLIHARLVLVHLAERDRVLHLLAGALRPGGWLVIEDFDSAFDDATHPESGDEAAVRSVKHSLRQMLELHGADLRYARTLPYRLEQAGLSEVGAEGRLVFARGGSAAAGVLTANLGQVGEAMQAAGLATAEEIKRAAALAEDPACLFPMLMMISAWGRKAGG
jgi:SAM-dependent methyltransferase